MSEERFWDFNPLFCLSPSAPYFFHLFLLAFLFVLAIGIFASIQQLLSNWMIFYVLFHFLIHYVPTK
jgi:hypothetical protein